MADPLLPGLCSITFRQLDVDTVADLAAAAGLAGVEWGADVHVPPGDAMAIRRAVAASRDAGLTIPSYGSYLVAGRDPDDEAVRVLDTAVALGATTVRVWAGARGSLDTDVDRRARITADLRRWSELGATRGLRIGTEYHAGTLTDTGPSTRQLLDEVDHADFATYWQPRDGLAGDADLDELRAIRNQLVHVHVFWWRSWAERFPLADGATFWSSALSEATAAPLRPGGRWALLEFVPGNDPSVLAREAATLRRLISDSVTTHT